MLSVVCAREYEAYDRCVREKKFGLRLGELVGVGVPAGALQEQAVYVGAVARLTQRRVARLLVHELKVETDFVDRDGVAARVVLQHAGKERLREEETRDPEDVRRPVVDPICSRR